jgi:hypothetical protein
MTSNTKWILLIPCWFHQLRDWIRWPSKAQWLLYVPPGLTSTNPTFCPHRVFMCFVWISEQTAIISLYSINWLVFITETECVYCAVRAEFVCNSCWFYILLVAPCQYHSTNAPFSSKSTRCPYQKNKHLASSPPPTQKHNNVSEIGGGGGVEYKSTFTFCIFKLLLPFSPHAPLGHETSGGR